MINYIRLIDVLSEIEKLDENELPVKVNMKFVTADRKRMTGGEIIELKGARKCVGKKNGKVIFDKRKATVDLTTSRDPRHYLNSTRNMLLPNGRIRKVHIRLIIEFNGKTVCF